MLKLKPNKKIILIAAVLSLLSGLFIFERTAIIKFLSGSSDSSQNDEAKTTSKAPSAQESFTAGNDRQPNQAIHNEGSITPSTEIPPIPSQDEWTISYDSMITLYSPSNNLLLSSGSKIYGKSTASSVSFRLIDNVSGVIAQGTIPVVSGFFSGTFAFSTSASVGRVDVYQSTSDGIESSNIEVPVRFK